MNYGEYEQRHWDRKFAVTLTAEQIDHLIPILRADDTEQSTILIEELEQSELWEPRD